MRLARFLHNQQKLYGVVEGESIREIEGDIFDNYQLTKKNHSLSEVKLLNPVDPPNIIAIGLNYRQHAIESGVKEFPERPVIFLKANTSIIGPGEKIILPEIAPTEVDYEAELVVVIGKKAKNIAIEEVDNYILGYTGGNDVSARDCQLKIDTQWARGKSFDTFCPIGPWIETELEPDNCLIRSKLNNKIMQESNTSDMIFSVKEIVSYCSHNMTLLPGTVIMTGTPEGVGFAREIPVFLKSGDVVQVEIEGIGALANPVQ